jgi:uncharacterized protein YodC (DUF2158 family)
MDLICNPALVKKMFKSNTSMRLKSNGGTMMVTHKAKVAGYHTHVWYNTKAITNILALSNVIKQYRVTYNSDDQILKTEHGILDARERATLLQSAQRQIYFH